METDAPRLSDQDREHLRLLSIFHFVVAAATAGFASIFLVHLAIGLGALIWPARFGPKPPDVMFGVLFTILGGGAVLAGWTLAALLVVAGRFLRRQVHHTFCLVVAAVACVCCQPLGTILGVFTILVLLRPGVKAAFQGAPA